MLMELPRKLHLIIVLSLVILVLYCYSQYNTTNKLHFPFSLPLWPHGETCGHADDRVVCSTCAQKPELWDCVGEDRAWGLVFVDNRPGHTRGPICKRMVTRSEVVVAHDTSYSYPEDWVNSKKSDSPTLARRRIFTDQTSPWTTVIQGDLDKDGAVFDKVVAIYKSGVTIPFVTKHNPSNSDWGSHIRLLTAAALATKGDLLEMGTGYFSTPLLHQIVEEEGGSRMIVSADTDSVWLTLFRNLTSPFHQIILVPVFEDGVTCGDEGAKRMKVKLLREMEFAGSITKELTTNHEISCPKLMNWTWSF